MFVASRYNNNKDFSMKYNHSVSFKCFTWSIFKIYAHAVINCRVNQQKTSHNLFFSSIFCCCCQLRQKTKPCWLFMYSMRLHITPMHKSTAYWHQSIQNIIKVCRYIHHWHAYYIMRERERARTCKTASRNCSYIKVHSFGNHSRYCKQKKYSFFCVNTNYNARLLASSPFKYSTREWVN